MQFPAAGEVLLSCPGAVQRTGLVQTELISVGVMQSCGSVFLKLLGWGLGAVGGN